MQVVFLGTGAEIPTNDRNVTSIAVIFKSSQYILIDCGEATQHQILKTSLELNKLEAIYITNLHGDHIFGLPGLLYSLNIIRSDKLTIHGPPGLSDFLAFPISQITNYNIEINEYMNVDDYNILSRHIIGESEYMVERAKVNYNILSYAYKITHLKTTTKIDTKRLYPKIDYYRNELEKIGYKPVEKIVDVLQNGESITLNNGFIFTPKNYSEMINDKSLVIVPNNYDSGNIQYYFKECDVLINEYSYSNNAYKVAVNMNASMLILTHFSNRYQINDDDSKDGQEKEIAILCANDFTKVCI